MFYGLDYGLQGFKVEFSLFNFSLIFFTFIK